MNKHIEAIKNELLITEGLMIAAAAQFEKDKPEALRKIAQVEAKLNATRSKVTQFLETDHFSHN